MNSIRGVLRRVPSRHHHVWSAVVACYAPSSATSVQSSSAVWGLGITIEVVRHVVSGRSVGYGCIRRRVPINISEGTAYIGYIIAAAGGTYYHVSLGRFKVGLAEE